MHLTPSDPDIATLYRKIKNSRLDLQPNFQRGEVWGKNKKQRLIDTILRGWHIPPIHVIEIPGSSRQEVLDGQQRLAAIRDFLEDEFCINGEQDPYDTFIDSLDGLYWSELPEEITSKIENFTVRVLTISDYKPQEPGELFYRLNQPTNLTSAEQRNAYFGEARQQIKDLAEYMVELGFRREVLGFSNSRMAYDDVLAKFLLTLEEGTLLKKITANTVTTRYRSATGFDSELIRSAKNCLRTLSEALSKKEARLNKATISSWLVFIHQAADKFYDTEFIPDFFFSTFESLRESSTDSDEIKDLPKGITSSFLSKLMYIYQDRASSRVADTSSVVLRDMIQWGVLVLYSPNIIDADEKLKKLYSRLHYFSSNHERFSEQTLLEISRDLSWGAGI
ncbi:DUF262 domain-containing protein [Ectopseudomonas composti]|uniref:GmrSD restriction endonuclease domain-containing protein n=1 Tax=Ectopseudomonas composti TaxID=658457 RepID=UPI0007742A7E|nr:DUF262 domain-containing protein [Pseudomonas composti]